MTAQKDAEPLDIDDVWAEMQKESRAAGTGSTRAKKVDLSAIQQKQRQRQAKAPPTKKLDQSLNWMQSWSTTLKKSADVGVDAFGVPSGQVEEHPLRVTEPSATLVDTLEELPTGTPETFLAFIQRDINCLAEDVLSVRLESLRKLERILVQQADSLSTDVVDAVADALLKPLLKRLRDKSEKCRELSVKVLRSLIENTSDLSGMLPYVFPGLVGRLGCEDLDGVAHLPEVMRPAPEQKPVEIARPVEESEEVRLELAQLVASLLTRCNQAQIYSYIDEATGLIRAQAMDPFHEVKAQACDTMISFCYNHTEMLLHFSEPLGRSLTSCLTHNHAKIRIAALRAMTAVFWCGVWKHNHEILQLLMAWQDPNSCPIKAFYEPMTSVNYLSSLSFDRHPMVRRFWFETIAYWLLRVPDKVDHEPYLFPYLLTGLCDENEEIALEVFWLIEKCGELYEEEHESDLRKTKQYGFDYGWTYNGHAAIPFPLQGMWAGGGLTAHKVKRTAAHGPDFMGQVALQDHRKCDVSMVTEAAQDLGEEVPVPERDYVWPELQDLAVFQRLPRPRLGSRHWVRTHTRRYILATFNDVVDFRDCTALNAGRLLCMSIAYTEEGVTEWFQPMFAALRKFYSGRAWASGDSKAMQTYDTICKLLGAFCDPVSYWEQLKGALDMDSALDLSARVASVRILLLCLEGSVETLMSVEPDERKRLGLGRLEKVVPELISALHASDLMLAPPAEARQLLWRMLFTFVEPLREELSHSQVSQLLYVALALAAKPPPDASTELASDGHSVSAPEMDEEELLDVDELHKMLGLLSNGLEPVDPVGSSASVGSAAVAPFSLDSLDDDLEPAIPVPSPAAPPPLSADPRVAHLPLFEKAFPEVLARAEESFHVFRSVLYLSPLSVLLRAENTGPVLACLAGFCGSAAAPSCRAAGQALAVHFALRCARFARQVEGTASGSTASVMVWRVFDLMAKAQLECGGVETLSYTVIVTGLSLWRSFLLSPLADPQIALFAPAAPPSKEFDAPGSSRPLEWLTTIMADQELYKKFHGALEHAEIAAKGVEKKDFVVAKSKQIREEADHRANVARLLAASTLLAVVRRMLLDSHGGIPWAAAPGSHGSFRALFMGVASLFRTATPTMEPQFVKPTPAFITMYAAELLHVLLQQRRLQQAGDRTLPPFRLLDDAARAIHSLVAPSEGTVLPEALALQEKDAERLTSDFVSALVDLNLTLPPDPEAKHAPVTLGKAGDDIVLGGDSEALAVARSSQSRGPTLPCEVTRLLEQGSECLRWNTALALYTLGMDLVVMCPDGFQSNLTRWRRRGEQARILLTADLLERARKAFGVAIKKGAGTAPAGRPLALMPGAS